MSHRRLSQNAAHDDDYGDDDDYDDRRSVVFGSMGGGEREQTMRAALPPHSGIEDHGYYCGARWRLFCSR